MLNVKFAKSMTEKSEGMNHVWIEVTPDKSKKKQEKPAAFVLVVDVSGSMNDAAEQIAAQPNTFTGLGPLRREPQATKLDFVKNAAEKLIEVMKDGDFLAVVSFSDMAQLEYPLTALTREERFVAKDRVRNLRTKGCTNVSDGLQSGYNLIPTSLKDTHHIKMMLLSDGEANRGIQGIDELSTLVAQYRKNDVSISSIGVGVQYNSYFMESIATSSGGMFYHLESMAQLENIFKQELELIASLTAKNVKISINVSKGLHLSSNLNGYSEEAVGKIYLGNVYRTQEVISEFFTKEAVEGVGEISITLEYEDEQNKVVKISTALTMPFVEEEEMGKATIDAGVVEAVKKLMTAKTQKEALRHYDAGDILNATGALKSSFASLRKMGVTYAVNVEEQVGEFQALSQNFSEQSVTRSAVKSMYAENYKTTRNEKK
jgi:Ca-activated chloride channel family protein